jgi:hypothetical protein
MPVARAKKGASRKPPTPPRSRSKKPDKKAPKKSRRHAKELIPDVDAAPPLTERERIFVEHFLFHHEIPPLLQMQAGLHSVFRHWTMKECEALLASPHIQEELIRRRELEELANAQQKARMRAVLALAKDLTPEFVKGELVESIEQSVGKDKVRAVGLGLAVTGVLSKGELFTPPDPKSNPAEIYRRLQITTLQRTTETITQTEEIAGEPERPALPAPDIEILDY